MIKIISEYPLSQLNLNNTFSSHAGWREPWMRQSGKLDYGGRAWSALGNEQFYGTESFSERQLATGGYMN